jgi:hypothetical protein
MKAVTTQLMATDDLSFADRQSVADVFRASFDDVRDANACLIPYFSGVPKICIARLHKKIVGFQFYQEKVMAGATVHHFSLAGRLAGSELRGLQARFGAMLIRRAILRTPPWKPVYLAGVTNSARSYANMHAVGGRLFPDVLTPQLANPFGERYLHIAEALRLAPIDESGLLKNRMQGLGFSMRPEAPFDHPIARAYGDYVGHDTRHGVFTLVELVPARDIPPYLFRRLFFKRRPSVADGKEA